MQCGEDNTKQVRVSLTETKLFMGKLPFWAGVPDGDSPSWQEGKCPWFDIGKPSSAKSDVFYTLCKGGGSTP